MAVKQRESETLGVLMIGFSPVVREGLQAILNKDEGIEVIEDAPDGIEALLHIKRARDRGRPVNVVLTESRNGKVDGVQATRLIKDEFPEIAVLVLTENLNDSYVIDAIHAGAGGYIFLKDMSPEMLLQSIHRVVEGGMQMKTELLHTAVENLIQNGRKTLAERTAEASIIQIYNMRIEIKRGPGFIQTKMAIHSCTKQDHINRAIFFYKVVCFLAFMNKV